MQSPGKLLANSTRICRKLPYGIVDADLDDFDGESQYLTSDCYLKLAHDCFVTADSVVYSRFRPISELLPVGAERRYVQTRYLAKQLIRARKMRLDSSKDYLVVTDLDSSGHFHWFTDVLPRIEAIGDCLGFVLILPEKSYIRRIGLDALSLMGAKFADIVFVSEGTFVSASRLFYVSPVSTTGFADDLLQRVRNRFIGQGEIGTRRLYVSRKLARFRKVVNESDILPALREFGFVAINSEEYSLSEQIELFRQCGTLIGIHGAGLTNCMFMPEGGEIVELRRKEVSNTGYWHLADSLGHRYSYFNGTPDSDRSIVGRGCNISVDPDAFVRSILERLK